MRASTIDSGSLLTHLWFFFFSLSEYGTARINIFPLATAWRLDGSIVTDGRAAKQWTVATAT